MTNATTTQRGGRVRAVALALVVLLTSFLVPSGVALAHTSFVGSTPQDGETVDDPVSTITLAFSGESEPAGEGIGNC